MTGWQVRGGTWASVMSCLPFVSLLALEVGGKGGVLPPRLVSADVARAPLVGLRWHPREP